MINMATTAQYVDIDSAWREYSATRDRSIRERLVIAYLGLVRQVVNRMPQASIPEVEYDDLLGYGVIGLMDAVERFDPARGVKFETYAATRIRGAIIDQLRDMDWVPRSVRQRARQIEQAIGAVESKLGQSAGDEEIAAELGVDAATLNRWVADISRASFTSLDELITIDDEAGAATLMDFVSDPASPDPELVTVEGDMHRILAEAIDSLPERERLVVGLYYYSELTVKEMAEVLGVSESRVSQLHTRAMMRMRAFMKRAVGP